MELSWLSFLILLSLSVGKLECAKILAIFPMPLQSHYIFIKPLLEKLSDNGHELTVFGLYPPKQHYNNFEHITVESNRNIIHGIIKNYANCANCLWNDRRWLNVMPKSTENMLEHEQLQKLMKNPQGKFDLIIQEVLWPSALSGLGEHFNAPMIAVSPFGATQLTEQSVGNISPRSIVPHEILPYGSRMNFWQRLHSFVLNMATSVIMHFYNSNPQRKFYQKYFPQANLSYEGAIASYSMLLVNQHHCLSFPRPYVTNVIEVGGMHIPENPEPLPKDMQDFLDSATHGAIYFSMGTNIRSKDLPIDKRNMFLNVFRGLKQKVLWKFEDVNLPKKSQNVYIIDWCPQNAILKHPNVKLFMTHGGLLSTTEAIFFGKPMLGIPMFAEQPRNVAMAVQRGIALKIDFNTVTEQELKHALEELLYNPKYTKNVAEISRQFHDQPMTPLQTAEFWTEYVLRHNGAKHMQSAAVHLNTLQCYSVDVIIVLLLVMSVFMYITKRVIKKLLRLVLRLKPTVHNVNKVNKKLTHFSQ